MLTQALIIMIFGRFLGDTPFPRQVAPSEADDDVHFDEERELEDLAKFRDAVDNEQFPDEVDTPIDVVARTRFQK